MRHFLNLKTTIRTRDFQASCDFYETILGLKKIENWQEPHDSGSIYQLGPAVESGLLEISYIRTEHDEFQEEFHEDASLKIDLQLATNNLESWVQRLQGNWEFKGPVDKPWGSRYIYFKDPDGVQIIIYERQKP